MDEFVQKLRKYEDTDIGNSLISIFEFYKIRKRLREEFLSVLRQLCTDRPANRIITFKKIKIEEQEEITEILRQAITSLEKNVSLA